MEKLDKHDPHIADIFRRATLEREQQDRRIADIFGTQKVPKVTEETLAIYLGYLKQHLEVPCQLTGIESLGCFAWEASYIFGRRRPKEYAQRKKQQPSYTDIYAWLNFEDAYEPYDGLAVTVKRVGCVFQIVSLCSRIEDLGIVSRDHLNRLTEIVAYQGPSPLPALALYHAAKRQNGLTPCHPPPHPRAF